MKKPFSTYLGVFMGVIIITSISLFLRNSLKNQEQSVAETATKKFDEEFDGPLEFAKYHRMIRMSPNSDTIEYPVNYRMAEYKKAIIRKKTLKSTSIELNWKERGPYNVGGRTWQLIVDPDDPTGNTWFTATAGGGIWKTTNAGTNWENITPDLPSLSVKSLAMAPSDHNVIYAGTGDEISGIDGVGIFKSTDKGNTWDFLQSTSYFRTVEKLFIDPENKEHIYALANWDIYVTYDGGIQWTKLRASNDFMVHPDNFSCLLSFSDGDIEKSTDAGLTWRKVYKFELPQTKVSFSYAPSNHNLWYAIGSDSNILVSYDTGETWITTKVTEGDTEPLLGNMGHFANTFTVDPYDQNHLIAGGVEISDVTVTGDAEEFGASQKMILTNTESFLVHSLFVFATTDSISMSSIEMRFGNGKKQKAHRFTVTDPSTLILPSSEYIYNDYVEVPFEVWDITNNKQLMLSFRDNFDEGYFHNNNNGTNYLLINEVEYSETPDDSIATQGGCFYKQIGQLFIYTFEEINSYTEIPESKINIEISQHRKKAVKVNKLSRWLPRDASNYVHADQLQIQIDKNHGIPYRIFSVNDGGVSYSDDAGITWKSPINGYVTTQFYGVDKHPFKDVYIGGTQDNGSWYSEDNPVKGSQWIEATGGDGFDAIWHPFDTSRLLTTIYRNRINLSFDGGVSWIMPVIKNTAQTLGSPFLTNIGYSIAAPDQLFFEDYYGIYRSDNFGKSWKRYDLEVPNPGRFPVEVSNANPDIVWAGTYFGEQKLYNERYNSLYVSTNKGLSFSQMEACPFETFRISDIATHPYLPNTAYVLFSLRTRPKVLKTDDLGKTWTDLSGFMENNVSSNGFPDVAVYCLLVMPYDSNEIWVGTDIGLFISKDGGMSWEIADNGLPNVAVWNMKVRGNQVIVATHGRGIWSVELNELKDIVRNPVLHKLGLSPTGETAICYSYMSDYDSVQVYINDQKSLTFRNTKKIVQDTMFLAISGINQEKINVQLKAYKNDLSCFSGTMSYDNTSISQPVTYYYNDFENDDAEQDFHGNNFNIISYTNFPGKAAHTSHPYPRLDECILYLDVPIIVKPNNVDGMASLKYTDIPMIDVGGSTFGESDFIHGDFVVVEGSKDGLTWTPVSEKYNFAIIIYEAFQKGVASPDCEPIYDIKYRHEYNLLDAFEENDTILIRFRLSSNQPDNIYEDYWGWMIDDLEIQGTPTNTAIVEAKDINSEISVYPNPCKDFIRIKGLPVGVKTTVVIYNASGNLVKTVQDYGPEIKVDLSGQPAGMYFIKCEEADSTYKIIKE